MVKTKTTGFYFKASEQEMEWIEKRMAQTGISNKSQFLRKMAIDGHVFVIDNNTLGEIGKLLRITANNVNQIAKGVNSGGGAYRNDVADVNTNLTALRGQFGKLLETLSLITEAKSGKIFTPPIKYSDLKKAEAE